MKIIVVQTQIINQSGSLEWKNDSAEWAASLQNTNRFATPCWTALRGFDQNGQWVQDRARYQKLYQFIS